MLVITAVSRDVMKNDGFNSTLSIINYRCKNEIDVSYLKSKTGW